MVISRRDFDSSACLRLKSEALQPLAALQGYCQLVQWPAEGVGPQNGRPNGMHRHAVVLPQGLSVDARHSGVRRGEESRGQVHPPEELQQDGPRHADLFISRQGESCVLYITVPGSGSMLITYKHVWKALNTYAHPKHISNYTIYPRIKSRIMVHVNRERINPKITRHPSIQTLKPSRVAISPSIKARPHN